MSPNLSAVTFVTLSTPRFTRFCPRPLFPSRTYSCTVYPSASASPSASTSTSTSTSTSPPSQTSNSISHLATSIRTGALTATENVDHTLRRLSLIDPLIDAFLTVDSDSLYTQAAELDKRIRNSNSDTIEKELPLCGVPIAIKDNLCTRSLTTTAGSRILDGFVPAYDATAVARLRAAGALILGKTNLDEFGMGSSTELSAYKQTKNPCDLSTVPGGSSGGSAAAVAAGICHGALGTDTGGSIRQPAAFCGVTGIRPSYGRVSRHGLLAYASSFDTIGPITRSVEDAALLLRVISGHDTMDSTSVDAVVPDYFSELMNFKDGNSDEKPLSSIRVGIVSNALEAVEGNVGIDPNIVQSVLKATQTLSELGATIISDIKLPLLDACVPSYYVLAMSEASANLARYDGIRYGVRDSDASTCIDVYAQSRADGFGEEVKRRIMAGTFSLSSGYYDAYYARAQRVRRLISDDLSNAFENGHLDVLITPVTPTAPFTFGQCVDDPLFMYLNDIMTLPASLAGIPAVSVPCGVTPNQLPIGLQIMAPYLKDDVALRVAHAFQKATSHHLQTKQLVDQTLAATT